MPAVPASAKMGRREPKRRFTDKPPLDPSAVWSLPNGHPALTESRTLFPSTVVDVDENFEGRLLVSGENNRKLGKIVTKGALKGYALYGLALEERATCPADCDARAFCYGNSMQLARRHRITDMDYFAALLEDEIREILEESEGLLVRLHVLGDFPSVEYVALWADFLDDHPKLACYGYTHWQMPSEIARAIAGAKGRFPDRFRIRWSSETPAQDGTIIISEIPEGPRFKGALVCPAQTDATACCASCGMCWEKTTAKDAIAFIKHGKKSMDVVASGAMAAAPRGARPVASVPLGRDVTPRPVLDKMPALRMVAPRSLLIEGIYQRDLSGASIKLIRKIVAGWDWSKFKPPICSETADGLFILDGQHTAIAAASHGGIEVIPVIVVAAGALARRAAAFVSHNRDRLNMTPAQIFYGDLAAGDPEAKRAMERVVKAGASVPRRPVARGYWKPGQIAAVGELRAICKNVSGPIADRILKIAVLSQKAPISNTLLRSLRVLMTDTAFRDARRAGDQEVAAAIASFKDFEHEAAKVAEDAGVSRFVGAAIMIEGKFVE